MLNKNKMQDFALSSQNCDHRVLQLRAPSAARGSGEELQGHSQPYLTCTAPTWASPHPCPWPRTPSRAAWGLCPSGTRHASAQPCSLGGACRGRLQLVSSCGPGPSPLCFWLAPLVYPLPCWGWWWSDHFWAQSLQDGVQSALTTHWTKDLQKILKIPKCALILIWK